jgi:gamma-glutamyltranspeptidase
MAALTLPRSLAAAGSGAATLEAIAKNGPDAFYQGALAADMQAR